jgi:hypothetical protein
VSLFRSETNSILETGLGSIKEGASSRSFDTSFHFLSCYCIQCTDSSIVQVIRDSFIA